MRQVSRRDVLKWGAAGSGMLALPRGEMTSRSRTTSRSSGKVTVVVSEQGAEFTPDVINRWNKAHPDIQIQTTQSTVNSGKLATQLASGTGPDTIRLFGAGELATYVARGVAMDISSRMGKDKTQFPTSQLESVDSLYRFNGSVQGKGPWYGMPKDWSQDYMLWYNKEVFAKAGIKPLSSTEPITWPELFSLAKELTTGGNFGLGYWNGNTQLDGSLLLLLMAQRGIKAWSADHKQSHFNQTDVADIVSTWTKDVVKPNIGPNSVNGSTAQVLSNFPVGKVGMILCGYWYSGDLRSSFASNRESCVLVPAPITPHGKRLSPTGAATGAIINAHTKHPEETWQVFSYLYGKDYAELVRAQSGWGLPTFTSRTSALPAGTAWDKALMTVQQAELKHFGIIDYNPYVGIDALNTAISTYINPVYFGKSSVSSALQQLDQAVNHTIQATMRSLGH